MVEDKNLEKTTGQKYRNNVGLLPIKISESFHEYWLPSGSKQCQYQNRDFKNSAVIEKDRTRHCTSSLVTRKYSLTVELVGSSWLCYSENQGNLCCFICNLLSKTNNKFAKGFNNWIIQS